MKKIKNMKIFPKMFLLTFLIMIFISILIHVSIYLIFPKFYVKNEEENILRESERIADSLNLESLDNIKKIIDIYSKNSDIKIFIKDEKAESNKEFFKVNVLDPKSYKNTVIIEEKEIRTKSGNKIKLQFIISKDSNLKAKKIILNYLPYTLLLSLFISFIISYIYTKIILRPIKDIKNTINLMKKRDKNAVLKIKSNDEINDMKKTINSLYKTLLKSIEDLDKQNKKIIEMEKKKVEFLRITSHALKTPISSIKIILENMKYNIGKFKDRDKYLEVAIENVDKINEMVKDIIYISSKKDLKAQEKEEISLKNEIDKIFKNNEILIKDKNILVKNKIKNEKIFAERKNLKIILENLINNAAKYTKKDGKIEIGLKGKYLYIKNECKVLSDEEIKKALELFGKINENNSTGLGLYIIKNILEDKDIKYCFRRYKKGMVFIFKLI